MSSTSTSSRPLAVGTSVEIGATGAPKVVADQVQLTHLFGERPCNHPKAATDGQHIVWTYGSDDFFENTVQTYARDRRGLQRGLSPIRISADQQQRARLHRHNAAAASSAT
jgi:hypothetical protein